MFLIGPKKLLSHCKPCLCSLQCNIFLLYTVVMCSSISGRCWESWNARHFAWSDWSWTNRTSWILQHFSKWWTCWWAGCPTELSVSQDNKIIVIIMWILSFNCVSVSCSVSTFVRDVCPVNIHMAFSYFWIVEDYQFIQIAISYLTVMYVGKFCKTIAFVAFQ